MEPKGFLEPDRKASTPASRRKSCGGQVMAEYAILILFMFMALYGVMAIFLDGVGDYYMNLVKIIALPFP